MNRRSFISRLVSCIAAAAITIRLEPPKPLLLLTETGRFSSTGINVQTIPTKYGDVTYKRHVFYEFPLDSTPLSGLLSLDQ